MGAGNPTTSGRPKPRSGRLPAPAAPQGAVLGIIYIYIIIHPHNSYIYRERDIVFYNALHTLNSHMPGCYDPFFSQEETAGS